MAYLGAGLAVVAVAVLAIMFFVQSSQIRTNQTVLINTSQSGCSAHLDQFNCTLILSSTQGAMRASQISAVRVNDTVAKTFITPLTDGTLSVEADIKITTIGGGALNDISVVAPLSKGQVEVSFSDGTVLSATLQVQFVE
jgi:hypothetical protein